MCFAKSAEFRERIGNALLNGERENLDITRLKLLPDLFL
jgi:hypothetical protein